LVGNKIVIFFAVSSSVSGLLVPLNDPEAVLIAMLAKAFGIPLIESRQPHGASLDQEPEIVKKIQAAGWKRVRIVEMPGLKTEATLRRRGTEVEVIDHHAYGNLDRSRHAKTRKSLPSSLEQFLTRFRITDARLCARGFDPKFVRGIGIMDRGFVWALQEEGYSASDIREVLRYRDQLMRPYTDPREETKERGAADRAWKQRKMWKGFLVVTTGSVYGIRWRISERIASHLKHPVPLMLWAPKRGVIYVQESAFSERLFQKFGGFTFGTKRNWGYKNEPGKRRITLKDVKQMITLL